MFKMDANSRGEEDEELRLGTEKILMTCVGVGFSNLSKTMT
jgi:RNA 3'-terminal phosphate cyclase-like protein